MAGLRKKDTAVAWRWGVVGFLSLVCCLAGFLNGRTIHADMQATALASVNVSAACTLTGMVDTPHTATIPAGTYRADIGITTFRVFCNDGNGYSIYAIGYSNEEYGNTKLLATIGGVLAPNYDIVTGTATSGETSNWAMKMIPVTGTYTPTIPDGTNNPEDFINYHAVPTTYTKVATFNSSTDITIGSAVQSTYAAFIAGNQPAGTYSGKVKYTLVHPDAAPAPVYENQIGVLYDGDGLTFPGGATTNRVIYEEVCEDEYGYISDTPLIIKTRNLNDDGTSNGSYEDFGSYDGNGMVPYPLEIEPGPSRLKIVVRYGLTAYTSWDIGVSVDNVSVDGDAQWWDEWDENRAGVATYVADVDEDYGSRVDIHLGIGGSTESGYDYGVYAQVYPIYDEPTEGTTYGVVQNVCSYQTVSGAYAETVPWNGFWWLDKRMGEVEKFYYEIDDEYGDNWQGVTKYLQDNSATLLGKTITLRAYNPYRILYDGNNATAGTMSGFATDLLTDDFTSSTNLLVPNFKKTGYGFAGWSKSPNAVVNSTDKIYGPNEDATGGEFVFDNNREALLYAVWVPSTGTMQGWAGCSGLSDGQVVALTDNRDNNVYTIGKQADGNCWMMENLRLDNTATTLSSSNTNNPASGFASLPATSDAWCRDANSACINQPKLNTKNTGMTNVGGVGASTWSLYGYGNYYNWYAATAGNGTYNTTTGNAAGDICPSGWSLPTGGRDGELYALDAAIQGSDSLSHSDVSKMWRAYPTNFVFSGRWDGSVVYDRGFTGDYWTDGAYSDRYAYSMYLMFSLHNPGANTGYKYGGRSVRCLAR